jgi:hypothetical protein
MLFNLDYIRRHITNNQHKVVDEKGTEHIEYKPVPYRWAHGATESSMGDGILIYSIIHFMRAKVCVCLGSGGGFIPRIMTQARQDLHTTGILTGNDGMSWGDIGTTYVVDAANEVGGKVNWLNEDSFFRKQFCPRIINDTTENAFYNFFIKEDTKIDYLHIDAGHSYEDVKNDFNLYSKILSPNGIISLHDTDIRYAEKYIVTKDITDQGHHDKFAEGPSKFIKEISGEWQRFDFFNEGIIKDKPSSTGLTLLRRA